MNLDFDGNGVGIIVVGGMVVVVVIDVDCCDDVLYWVKYCEDVVKFGLIEVIVVYSIWLKIILIWVWMMFMG